MDAQCSFEVLKTPHDIIASIEHREHQLFIEVPEPWERVFGLSPHFPPKLLPVLQTFAKTLANTSTSVFAPDPEYSSPHGLRVLYLRYAKNTLSYDRFEWVIPAEKLADVLNELLNSDAKLRSSTYAVEISSLRDYFICTHANRDRCCGVLGNGLYEKLRKDPQVQKANLRIFRSSHIGGHRYAPTMLESPTLNCWGQLTEDATRQIVLRDGELADILDHYRGSAALSSSYFQVAEKEMMRRQGWDWFLCQEKSFEGKIHPEESQIEVRFTNKDSTKQFYLVEVLSSSPVGLRANCDEDKISLFPQYKVQKVQRY